MFDTQNKISFSTFYLVEFFRQSAELGRSEIPEDQFEMLAELGGYLTSDDDVLSGIEKLARYKGTNELSIFFFDLTERSQENPAQQSYDGLSNQVEDFINLFSLMMEEKESVRDLGRVLDYFRVQKPVTEEEVSLPKDLQEETETLSFSAFYEMEIQRIFDLVLKDVNKEHRADFRKLRQIFSSDKSDNQTYDATVKKIRNAINKLAVTPDEKAYQKLEKSTVKFIQLLQELQTINPDHYLSILENEQIPDLFKEQEKPMTVDALLEDYFLSEVNEQVKRIHLAFEEENSARALEDLLKSFKSLKEISMIHGYGGIEYFSEQVLFALAAASDKHVVLNTDSKEILEEITDELIQLDRYKDESQSERIKNYITSLKDSLDKKPELPAVKLVQRNEAFPVFKEVMQALFDRFKAGRTKAPVEVLAELSKFSVGSVALLNLDAAKELNSLLLAFSNELNSKSDDDEDEALSRLEQAWEQALNDLKSEQDLDTLLEILCQAMEQKKIVQYGLKDEEKIREMLVTSMRLAWLDQVSGFHAFLTGHSKSGELAYRNYLDRFESNISLTGYNSFKSVLDYFRDFESGKTNIDTELADEVIKSFDLALDRLLSAGTTGDYSDILEVLTEVLKEAEELPETKPEIESETIQEAKIEPEVEQKLSEEEELEQDFRTESALQLTIVRDALTALEKDENNRSTLADIGSAVHAIRSSAHLLNKGNIAEFSVNLEEASEMFEPIEVAIPENLTTVFRAAADQLELMVNGEEPDTSEVEAQIDTLMNTLIVEDVEPVDELQPEQEETSPEYDSDIPLFAEDEDSDEELVSIFKEESEKYLNTLQESTEILKSNFNNEEALNALDYAAHSLRSSAKMLGFREISQLTAGMEEVIDGIKNKELENSETILSRITETISTIQRLCEGEKISPAELAETVRLLDVSQQKIESESPEDKAPEKDAPDSAYMTDIFVGEANELLDRLDHDLVDLEQMPESATLLSEIIRNLHTLKGGAMMVDYKRIGELTHKLEDYFQLYREQNGEVKLEMLAPAFTALDLIKEMVKSISKGKEESVNLFTSKLAEIDNKLFFYQNFDPDTIVKKAETDIPVEDQPVQPSRKKEENVVKINTEYLDNLVNMATELVVNRTELSSNFDDLKELMIHISDGKKQIHYMQNKLDDLIEDAADLDSEQDKVNLAAEEAMSDVGNVSMDFKKVSQVIDRVTSDMNKLSRGFEKNIQQISNLSKTLHKDILRVRMLPVEYLFDRFPRAVRDLARSQDKRVTVAVEGNKTEMDRAVIEALADPVMHILRNAVDHGIEDGDVRKKNNKTKTGKITLKARQEKSQVIIDISDDGKGIDLDKVKRQAVKRGLATRPDLKKMNEAEILDFIFYSEFSTKDKATDVSGRGVGLDVVASQIQKLKGVIRIRTEKNFGTTFSIRVPLTLVISQALMTRIHNHSIAVPMIAVQESQEIDSKEILVDDNKRYIQARGKLLPYLHLSEILSFDDDTTEAEGKTQVLILHDAGISVALGIGEITGRQEIVIKSLGNSLQNVEFVAGGTILGNGEVALILDYAAIIRMIEFQFFGNIREARTSKGRQKKGVESGKMELQSSKEGTDLNKNIPQKKIKGRKARILIVDDSISVRSFVGAVLEKQGFAVTKATDGQEAIDILDKNKFDLMITDLEMPQLGGFKLIEKTRARTDLNKMPIVILTGRTGKKQRDRGTKLGANAFIGKPFKEEDLVKVIRGFIAS